MYVTLVSKLTYVKISSSPHLAHGKAGLGAEIAARRPGFHIAVGEIEASRRRRTGERAVGIAAFDRSSFKRGQQGAADAAKTRVRRDVVQVVSPASVTDPTATIFSASTATIRELPGRAIQEATMSGRLQSAHRRSEIENG